ncbi:DNA/RNA non-specific endonuclease [Curtobacterium sp. UNCCL20]|uniref:DNA/RNA non-specific endonuclease n=1 Tax=Curtobacterium sp. UNCCL20 TaxID=1502773 RepID=UPI00088BA9DE|nr:DNA/RNA non-specific endonuclease [Curtobacterium sp. UNCCL20]SDR00934.1 DNA/RNA non-specific endonuclease [Curtobacterium sp. UNCCL20]
MTGQCRADGLIDPAAIPGANIKAEQVDSAGTAFSTSATDVQTRGSAVKTAWAKLGGSYTTPDSAELLTVMDGVETDTASLAATLQKVSTHLSHYATAVAPIAKRLVELKAEAETFVAKALKGKTVGPWDPEHPANQGIVGLVQNFGQQFDDAHLRWDEYTPYVDENNDLLTKVAEQETKLSAASAECVNAINGLRTDMCLAEVQAVDYTAAVKANQPMPWGSTGRGDQSCSESFSSGMDDALHGTLDGLGGLVGYNSQTGGWGDGDWAAQSWKGFAESLGLIALMGSPPLLIAGALPKGILPDVVSDTARSILDQQKTLVEGFVGSPEDWRDDPAHAAGGAAFNIGTLFIPGAGEVGAGAKVAALGSRLAVLGADGSKLAAFGSKLATAGTAMVRVGDALGSLSGKALSGASDLLAGSRGGFANALRWLGDKIPTVKVSVEHAVATPDGFGFGVGRPHIEVGHPEPGSHWLHSVADHVDGAHRAESSSGAESNTGTIDRSHSSGPGDGSPSVGEEPRSSGEAYWQRVPADHDQSVLRVAHDDPSLKRENLQPNTRYELTDRRAVYYTDDRGRPATSEALIDRSYPLSERVRDGGEQRYAGGADRLPEDHGGHIVSAKHGGSPFGVNLTPEHGRAVNLGDVRRVENDISRLLREDPSTPVYLKREIQFDGTSERGSVFLISWGREGADSLQQVIIENPVSFETSTRAGRLKS